MRLFVFILFLNFLSISNIYSSERDKELNNLFLELKVNNINLAYKIEQKIWKIWSTHPTDKNLTEILEKGSNLVNRLSLIHI